MLGFFKGMFKKEAPVEKVGKKELKEWFLDKKALLETDINRRIGSYKDEIRFRVKEGIETSSTLEKAKLHNPKIPVRELQFMEGNRKAYVLKSSNFFRQIEEIIDHEPNIFLNCYKDSLEAFTKSTSRAYAILQNFFANESKGVALKIKDIDMIVERMRNDPLIKKRANLEQIMREFTSADNQAAKERELKDEVQEATKEKEGVEKRIKPLEEDKKKYMESDHYKTLQQDITSKKNIESDVRRQKDDFYNSFSLISKTLRKYRRVALENEKLIEHYEVDPVNALITDHHFAIAKILEHMADTLKRGSLQDKNSEKIISQIQKMDIEYFKSACEQFNSNNEKMRSLEKKIGEESQELAGIDEKLNTLKDKLVESGIKVNRLMTEINSLKDPTDRIKGEIESLLCRKIEITQ